MTDQSLTFPRFFLTAPATCPYLPDKTERKLFTELQNCDSGLFHDSLSKAGFRRSQNIAYRPACPNCSACVSVRLRVENFQPSQSIKRAIRAHSDLIVRICPPSATEEQYALLSRYLLARHEASGMTGMDFFDYADMVENTTVETVIFEYRERAPGRGHRGRLVAAALSDVMSDGLSMVYSFFEAENGRAGLGNFMIADHAFRARDAGFPFLYLGYWIENCRKMTYKARFQPLERLDNGKWVPFAGTMPTP